MWARTTWMRRVKAWLRRDEGQFIYRTTEQERSEMVTGKGKWKV